MEISKIDLDHQDTTPARSRSESTPSAASPKPMMEKKKLSKKLLIFIPVVVAGFFAGYYIKTSRTVSSLPSTLKYSNIQSSIPESGAKVGDIYGSADEKAFRDKSTGVIAKGGFNGEGTHRLVRAGGASQTVYLTSSVIDLDTLVGHEVTVWGETFKGQKVGWLMDVGRAKIEALNAPLPN